MIGHRRDGKGSVAFALRHATRLLDTDPARALEQADEILRALPGHPEARLTQGIALRRLGRLDEARQALQELAAAEPRSAATAHELGGVHADLGEQVEAIASLRRAVTLKPDLADAWHALGDALRLSGVEEEADRAYLAGVRASARDPALLAAATSLIDGRLAQAEAALRKRIETAPSDVAALRMLGETLLRQGRLEPAEAALRRALALAPGFAPARELLARSLQRRNQFAEALGEVARLRTDEPANPSHIMLEGALLARTGDQHGAAALYETVLARHPHQPKGWMSLGHVLKAIGRSEDAIVAYRTAIRQQPSLGEAWWSLANLKTFRFSAGDIAAMRAALTPAIGDEDRLHLHFALGKALEDEHDDAGAFTAYAEGARIRRGQLDYDVGRMHAAVAGRTALCDADFFRMRGDGGYPASDPIFVVGLPRAGSTLLEQILASHSRIEGIAELPDLMTIAGRLGGIDAPRYCDALATLTPEERCALGEDYIARTRIHRRTDRPFFIDKLPNNWMHVALIRLILPNARIIDARRHPLGCCWSAFKQHFARGQEYSYDLRELGLYYRDYTKAIAGIDAALPGYVHRVLYERVVADVECETRTMLTYLGLDFEPACLAFWKSDRAVRTPSSEQVRQPIYTDGVDHWRRFAAWLGPLSDALGDTIETYDQRPPIVNGALAANTTKLSSRSSRAS